MVDPIQAVATLVANAITEALGPVAADPMVRRSERADLQCDVATGLARTVRQPPRQIAERIVAALAPNDVIARTEIAGAGFINITLHDSWLAQAIDRARASDRLGVPEATERERIVIDYSAPNVAKEMHVGHLRSTILGDAIARVLAWRGHTVIRQNHLGDWGTPFGMLIEHFVDLGDEAAARELAMGELGVFYKAARKKFEADPAFADRSRRRVVALQAGDSQTLAWWRQLIALSTQYFEAVYRALGVLLEPSDVCPESFYNPRLAPLADELAKSGHARVSDGALCVFPTGFKNREGGPLPLMLRKSDGGYGYATTDLAAIRYRLTDLGGTRLVYIVGAPQAQHLTMVHTAARELGWLAPPVRAEHVPFGFVLGEDGKPLKSREGAAFRLVDLIDRAIARAAEVIETVEADRIERLGDSAPRLDPVERVEVARIVGVGAIKYADLSNDRIKDYIFSIGRMVAFKGDAAGFLQYTAARVRGLWRKLPPGSPIGPAELDEPIARALAFRLLAFGAVVRDVEQTLKPHRLAGYLFDVATAFSELYDAHPILGSPSRLALAELTERTLVRGLDLLGIEVPARM
jgi:arginyl-tRNA synthetase